MFFLSGCGTVLNLELNWQCIIAAGALGLSLFNFVKDKGRSRFRIRMETGVYGFAPYQQKSTKLEPDEKRGTMLLLPTTFVNGSALPLSVNYVTIGLPGHPHCRCALMPRFVTREYKPLERGGAFTHDTWTARFPVYLQPLGAESALLLFAFPDNSVQELPASLTVRIQTSR